MLLKFTGLLLGVLLLLGGSSTMWANHWGGDWCSAHINKERRDLDRAIYRFGPYSPQANAERYELNRVYNRCAYGSAPAFGFSFQYNRGYYPRTYQYRDRDDYYRYRYYDRDDHYRYRDRDDRYRRHDRDDDD